MNESLSEIRTLINKCSSAEQASLRKYLQSLSPHPLETEWKVDSDTILSAIRRANDITKRGVRGIIAEAVFEKSILPGILTGGWRQEVIVGDLSYDIHLSNGPASVRIQIKLQRLVKGEPFLYYPKHYEKNSLYVVEVQKTRTGKRKPENLTRIDDGGLNAIVETSDPVKEDTRPYKFGDFDILAVNMHPSSGNWKDFRYTVGSWLVPRPGNPSLIEIFQPVAAKPNEVWTSDLLECVEWFLSGEKRNVMVELLHRRPKGKKQVKAKTRSKKSAINPDVRSR